MYVLLPISHYNTLQATVEYMLDNYQFNDAVFLAERLYNNGETILHHLHA